MKNRIVKILLILFIPILISCSSEPKVSNFSIKFIDVGQGDAALINCDGNYMLIDGGDKGHANKVYDTLVDEGVTHLDILAISHTHDDHIGGLAKALTWATTIDLVLCANDDEQSDTYADFKRELSIDGATVTEPIKNKEYQLGSAVVKVLTFGKEDNDSLVLLITYGQTSFLFTGDMEQKMETILCDELNDNLPVSLLKVAHHGSQTSTSIRFLRMLTDRNRKQYAVISVGRENRNGHPNESVLSRLDQADFKVYRTDTNGDITVTSDGKELTITTSK